jgi:hypothetical protein
MAVTAMAGQPSGVMHLHPWLCAEGVQGVSHAVMATRMAARGSRRALLCWAAARPCALSTARVHAPPLRTEACLRSSWLQGLGHQHHRAGTRLLVAANVLPVRWLASGVNEQRC